MYNSLSDIIKNSRNIKIATMAQLIEHAISVAEKKATWDNVEILPSATTIVVAVCGEGWDKRIDARGAKYIVDVQKKVDEIFDNAFGGTMDAPVIKVEVTEGSNFLSEIFGPAIEAGIANMSSQEFLEFLKYGVLCWAGAWGITKITGQVRDVIKHNISEKHAQLKEQLTADSQAKRDAAMIELSQVHNEPQAELVKTLQRAIEKLSPEKQIEQVEHLDQLEKLGRASETLGEHVLEDIPKETKFTKPIRDYVDSLSPKDRISIAMLPPLPAKVVKPWIKPRRRPPTPLRHVPCDSVFVCTGLNLKQREPRLDIAQDGIAITALLGRLEPEERKKLLERIEERMATRHIPFNINLQVDVYYTNAGIRHATVIGLGPARKKLVLYKLSDIPKNVEHYYDEYNPLEKLNE